MEAPAHSLYPRPRAYGVPCPVGGVGGDAATRLLRAHEHLPLGSPERVVVVGVLGKTRLGKGELLNGLAEAPLCPSDDAARLGAPLDVRVVHQPRQRRILLCLNGPFDAPALLASVERAAAGGGGGEVSAALADQDFEHVKAMLYVFQTAHIVLVASEGPRVDMQLLRALRVLQCAKQSLGTSLGTALGPSGALRTLTPGRGAPSLCFVFRVPAGPPFSRRNVEKLQGSLDKQLAYLLRKMRLPEGKGAEQLFTLSKEGGTACVVSAHPTDDIVGVFSGLFGNAFEGRVGGSADGGGDSSGPGMRPLVEIVATLSTELRSASDSQPARGSGADAKKKPPHNRLPTALPSAAEWFVHAAALHDLFLFAETGRSGAYAKAVAALQRQVLGGLSDVSWQYSTGTCERAMPVAAAAYLEGLPERYTRRRHNAQLARVLDVFRRTAVGPACPRYHQLLEVKCEAVWSDGRQLCDAVSLSGQPCRLAVHPPSTPHDSELTARRACDCGRSVEECADAFVLDQANRICRPCCLDSAAITFTEDADLSNSASGSSSWSLHRLGSAADYKVEQGLELPGFAPGRNRLWPWLTAASAPLPPEPPAPTAADAATKQDEASEWPTLAAFPKLLSTGNGATESGEPEEEEGEEDEEQRAAQQCALDEGLGRWLVGARRAALSAAGKENDDELALRQLGAEGGDKSAAVGAPVGEAKTDKAVGGTEPDGPRVEAASSAGRGGKKERGGRRKGKKLDDDGAAAAKHDEQQPAFDSHGRPIIRLPPGAAALASAGKDSAAALASASPDNKSDPSRSWSGKSPKGKQANRKPKGAGLPKEEDTVRVGFEYECTSCGCRTLADGGVATVAAVDGRVSPEMPKPKARGKAGRRRKGKEDAEAETEGDEQPAGAEEADGDKETAPQPERRKPLGAVTSMPVLHSCRQGACRQPTQLRRIFFTTPSLLQARSEADDGEPASPKPQQAELGPAPPKTIGGLAVDHAAVSAWRCALRLQLGSLSAAFTVQDGVVSPALKQQPPAGAAAPRAHHHRAKGQPTTVEVLGGRELILPPDSFFVLRLPSVPLYQGKPLLVGALAEELRDSPQDKERPPTQGGPGVRIVLADFLRPVGGKEEADEDEP